MAHFMQNHSHTAWNLYGFRTLSKPPADQEVNRSCASRLGGGAADTDVGAKSAGALVAQTSEQYEASRSGDQIEWVLWM